MFPDRDRWLVLVLTSGILLCMLLVFLFPAPPFSESENRYLAPRPVFSPRGIVSGDFEKQADLYLTERFPLRAPLRRIRAACELALGKKEVRGVLVGKDGRLVAREVHRERILLQNLRALGALSEKIPEEVPCVVAVAPRTADVLGKSTQPLFCPDTAAWDTLHATLSGVIDLRGIDSPKDWYRTDHHWTTSGAYGAYFSLCAPLGVAAHSDADFRKTLVTSSFWGTTQARAGVPFLPPDDIGLYRDDDTVFHVLQNGTPAPFSGLYDIEKLQTHDKYAVFLGGNFASCEVRAASHENRPLLLLIKDSFANSVIPFLAEHFDILALDPRYGALPDTLPACDAVLVLMGMQTLGATPLSL